MAKEAVAKKPKQEEKKKTKKQEAPREPQFYRAPTGERTLNYNVYYMSPMEKVIYFLLAFAAGAAVGLLFYGGIGKDEFGDPTTLTRILDTVIACGVGLLCGKLFLPIRTEQIRKSRQKKLRSQFRDMLEALVTALGAGKNVRDSFISVHEDLQNQYEEGAFILQELAVLIHGMNNGISIEQLLQDFGRRSGSTDIQDFAEVFDICYRQGGNIKDTIRNTCDIIGDKMAVAEDIETTVTGSKNEQYIMLVMPIMLIGMIKLSSPDFANNFTSPAGLISTSIGMVMFVASYYLGTKVLDIKV